MKQIKFVILYYSVGAESDIVRGVMSILLQFHSIFEVAKIRFVTPNGKNKKRFVHCIFVHSHLWITSNYIITDPNSSYTIHESYLMFKNIFIEDIR